MNKETARLKRVVDRAHDEINLACAKHIAKYKDVPRVVVIAARRSQLQRIVTGEVSDHDTVIASDRCIVEEAQARVAKVHREDPLATAFIVGVRDRIAVLPGGLSATLQKAEDVAAELERELHARVIKVVAQARSNGQQVQQVFIVSPTSPMRGHDRASASTE